jgi:hypothetical protein
MAPINSK